MGAMGGKQSVPCAPCGSKARVAEPAESVSAFRKQITDDWGDIGSQLYNGCTIIITGTQPDFTGDFFAKYYTQLGVKDRSDVGQQYGGDISFHDCFFPNIEMLGTPESPIAAEQKACEIMGSTQDIKLLELASAVFAMNIEHFSKNSGLKENEVDQDPYGTDKHGAGRGPRFHYFDNLDKQYYNFQTWLGSTNIGKQGKEAEWLLAEMWMQTVIDFVKAGGFMPK
jgi:hypothetical protein